MQRKKRAPSTGRTPFGEHFLRERIVQAATRVFANKGMADATVEDILHDADVSRRTFYRFFQNKESVLEAIHDMASELLVGNLGEASDAASGATAKAEACVDVFLRFSQAAGPLMSVMSAEALRPGSRLAPKRAAMLDRVAALIAEQIRSAGRTPPDRLVLLGVIAAVEGISRRVYQRHNPDGALVSRARAAMLRIVGATLAEHGDAVPPLPRAGA